MTSTCYYVFIPLEMHARLICAIKFYLLTYILNVIWLLSWLLGNSFMVLQHRPIP